MAIFQPMETMVRTYDTRSQYKKDLRKQINAGWHVASVSERLSRYPTMMDNLIKARVTIIRPPKRKLVVTYSRPFGSQVSANVAAQANAGRKAKIEGIARKLAARNK